MESLGIEMGDIIGIKGKKKTAARCLPLHTTDDGKKIIRIDGITRNNLGVTLGDKVEIKKIESFPAESVTIIPFESTPSIDERYLTDALENTPIMKGDAVTVRYFGGKLVFRVLEMSPQVDVVVVTNRTEFHIREQDTSLHIPMISYEDVGGLDDVVKKIRETVELPLKHPEIFEKLGVESPKGILLYGIPGTGKTLLAKAVASESRAHFISVSGPEIIGKFYGESEARLRDLFKEARENAPTIIFIDEIDSIAPKREEVTGEVERRVVSQMLSLMDGLQSRGKVIVIAATNRPNSLDPALRRPGRFDREIEVKVPNKKGRRAILNIHTRNMPLVTNLDDPQRVDLDRLASISHGYVGADLEYLCKESAMKCLRRLLPELNLEEKKISSETLDKLVVNADDYNEAFRDITPAGMREVRVENPDVSWDDVGGLVNVKRELQEAVEWPMKYPAFYSNMGHRIPRGILLYGSSGTGKTLLAKAVATESEANFISIRGPELLSKWVGESEKGIREIFKRARQASPCVIFFDEIDSIASIRGASGDASGTQRVVSQILTEMDGMETLYGVVVLAATNRPDMLDQALLRPGRFDKIIQVPPPDKDSRKQILEISSDGMAIDRENTADVGQNLDRVNFDKISNDTEGFSGADVVSVVNTASSLAIHEFLKKYPEPKDAEKHVETIKVTMTHLEEAVRKVRAQKKIQVDAKIDVPYYA
jgi:transitional endoplasmic reticulum ATPase